MTFLVPISLCFILYVTVFIVFALLVPKLKIRYELWATFLGLAAVVPIAFVEYLVLSFPVFTATTYFSVLLTALIFNGLVEESLKMFFMLLIPTKKTNIQSFFACTILCGLAFGSFESVIYMLTTMQKITAGGAQVVYQLIFARMGTAVLIHTFCAGLSGLYIWSFKKSKKNISTFLFAIVLHGLHNFFAGYPKPFYWFVIPVILFAAIECRIHYLGFTEKKKKITTT